MYLLKTNKKAFHASELDVVSIKTPLRGARGRGDTRARAFALQLLRKLKPNHGFALRTALWWKQRPAARLPVAGGLGE